MLRERLALVEGAGDPRGQRVHQRGERLRLAELGLSVGDPDLDGRESEMRAHAPPDLSVLRDGAGVVEKADVPLELVPAAERIRDPTPREHPREDLRARRVKAGEDPLDERRAGRVRQQVREKGAKRVGDRDRAVGALDADVDVQAEAVVAPDDVAENLVVAAVVRRVDDALLLPRAPGMRAGGAEGDVEARGQLQQLPAALGHRRGRLCEGLASSRAHLDLRGDQLADEVLRERRPLGGGLELLEAVDEPQRLRVEDGELLLDGDREVAAGLESFPSARDLLLGSQFLGVTHGPKVSERPRKAAWDRG